MPRSSDQVTRIATEEQTMANIAWAKAQAMKADSPEGLTALAKSFWHAINKQGIQPRRGKHAAESFALKANPAKGKP